MYRYQINEPSQEGGVEYTDCVSAQEYETHPHECLRYDIK